MILGLEELFEAARKKQGATKKERLDAARKRSEDFNKRCEREMEQLKLTPELLQKRCTL